MKIAQMLIVGILATFMLAGCTTNKKSACYPGGRCNEYQVYTRCGSYIRYECETICQKCKAYEPQCYSCMACIDSHPQECLNKRSVYYGCGK